MPEALISIVLLASLVLYFILAFTVGKYATQLSKNRMIMSNLLRSEMENVLATNYNSITASTRLNESINDGSKTISVTTTVDIPILMEQDAYGIYGYKKVHVKLDWMGGVSGTQHLSEEAVLYVTNE